MTKTHDIVDDVRFSQLQDGTWGVRVAKINGLTAGQQIKVQTRKGDWKDVTVAGKAYDDRNSWNRNQPNGASYYYIQPSGTDQAKVPGFVEGREAREARILSRSSERGIEADLVALDKFHVAITVTNIDYHRNGIGGEPFYVVHFIDHDNDDRTMLGVVFDSDERIDSGDTSFHNPHVAVFDATLLPDTTFGRNSFRGDNYAPALYRAIAERETGLVP